MDFVKPWNNAEGVVMAEHRLSDVLCFAFANARRWDCPVDHWPVVQRDAPSALAYIGHVCEELPGTGVVWCVVRGDGSRVG